ncbi:hypothetical protein KIN20_015704 [Parelaphostrongylus tenuis]|uniref:Uncharacterized protein n=1 Tax=Parelaphostrongylus tenuis TaxID=148309 RepID=A0AAD5QQ32_PARTN|nr:hypothetical protein KIN20_015704 [Parelaphostrongylus tenuis]
MLDHQANTDEIIGDLSEQVSSSKTLLFDDDEGVHGNASAQVEKVIDLYKLYMLDIRHMIVEQTNL